MDSGDQKKISVVKMEIDVAEEPPVAGGMENYNYKPEPMEDQLMDDFSNTRTCDLKFSDCDCDCESVKTESENMKISRLVTEAADLHSSEFKDFIVEYYGKNRESEDTSDEDSEEFEDAAATETKSGETSNKDHCTVSAGINKDEEAETAFPGNADKCDKTCISSFRCSCKLNNGQPCSLMFSPVELQALRERHQQLTRVELDLIVLAQIGSTIHTGELTVCSKQKEQTKRKRVRTNYYHNGHSICRCTFMYMHSICRYRLTRLIAHYREYGVVPRLRGKANNTPRYALSYTERLHVVRFIHNFAEDHAVLLFGRIPGYDGDDLKLLPSSCTKAAVYKDYMNACAADNRRLVPLQIFNSVWQDSKPEVLSTMPTTDLCRTCQRNMTQLMRAANCDEEMEVLTNFRQHIQLAIAERDEYKRDLQRAEDDAQVQRLTALQIPGNNIPDCSRDMMAHYSFDVTQQVHYPADPQQPGPINFRIAHKCAVFGVMAEALPQMTMFLLDEAVETGKGNATVISLLDFFFQNYGLKETECHLHANNCAGRGKTKAMIQYLLWRVMTGRHKKITLSFHLEGHARFAPEWCFGLFKTKFRHSRVDSLADIVQVASSASTSGIIVPQLCGDEAGNVFVPTRDWAAFLDGFFQKPMGLKKYHHFIFHPSGEVHAKLTCTSAHQVMDLKKDDVNIPQGDLPSIVLPKGLSQERKEYLFREVREFVKPECRDLVCPQPSKCPPSATSPSISSATALSSPPSTGDTSTVSAVSPRSSEEEAM